MSQENINIIEIKANSLDFFAKCDIFKGRKVAAIQSPEECLREMLKTMQPIGKCKDGKKPRPEDERRDSK